MYNAFNLAGTYDNLLRLPHLGPVCCKKQQKEGPDQLLFCGIGHRGPLKILNGIKLILDDQGNHLDSYTISLESFGSFKVPLSIPQTSIWPERFLLFFTANRL